MQRDSIIKSPCLRVMSLAGCVSILLSPTKEFTMTYSPIASRRINNFSSHLYLPIFYLQGLRSIISRIHASIPHDIPLSKHLLSLTIQYCRLLSLITRAFERKNSRISQAFVCFTNFFLLRDSRFVRSCVQKNIDLGASDYTEERENFPLISKPSRDKLLDHEASAILGRIVRCNDRNVRTLKVTRSTLEDTGIPFNRGTIRDAVKRLTRVNLGTLRAACESFYGVILRDLGTCLIFGRILAVLTYSKRGRTGPQILSNNAIRQIMGTVRFIRTAQYNDIRKNFSSFHCPFFHFSNGS